MVSYLIREGGEELHLFEGIVLPWADCVARGKVCVCVFVCVRACVCERQDVCVCVFHIITHLSVLQ